MLDLTELAQGTVQWRRPRAAGVAPPPTAAHSAIVDKTSDSMVLFGGRAQHNRTNELHVLHLPSLTWRSRCVSAETEEA